MGKHTSTMTLSLSSVMLRVSGFSCAGVCICTCMHACSQTGSLAGGITAGASQWVPRPSGGKK